MAYLTVWCSSDDDHEATKAFTSPLSLTLLLFSPSCQQLSLGEQPDFAGVVSAAVNRSRAASGQQQGIAVSTQGRSSLAPHTPANTSAGQQVSKSNNQDFRAASGRPPKPHSGNAPPSYPPDSQLCTLSATEDMISKHASSPQLSAQTSPALS